MKIIFGTIFLLIFIVAVGGIAFTYVFSVNNNIDNMLKKKGFKNYRNYKKRAAQSKPLESSIPEQRKVKPDKYNERYNYKMQKKEEKRQVEEYLYYEINKRRK